MIWLSSGFNRMAEKVLQEYNPDSAVFSTLIYGPAGVGKSTLLTNCYHRLKENNQIFYIDARDFVKNYTFAAQERNLSQFRHRFRTPRLLIIDHIEFFKEKPRSIEEFYHTYETLFQGNSRIISGFRGEPSQLDFLGNKLSSRLLGGLAVPISQPSPDEMLKYLNQMAHNKYLVFEDYVLETMSKEINNFLEAQEIMQGFLHYANNNETALNHKAFLLFLADRKFKEEYRLAPENIIKKAADIGQIPVAEIYGASRAAEVRVARQLAIYGIRTLCKLSYPEIGKILNKSHSSIIKSYQQFEAAIKQSLELKEKSQALFMHFTSEKKF